MAVHFVVPAYGPSEYLAETLQSLVDVLPPGCRVSVLDDASPGDEVELQTRPFGHRVDYWRNETNLGVSGAFNAAVERVTSRFVVLVGPDDRGLPRMLEAYLSGIAAHPMAAAVHPGVRTIDEHGRPAVGLVDWMKSALRPNAPALLRGQGLATRLLVGNWTYNPAIAWRTDFVRQHRFDERLHTAMDLDLLLRLAFAGESVALVDGPALEYRRHSGAVSSVNAGSMRLAEELEIHAQAAVRAHALGWRQAAAAARLAPTARLHGLVLAVRSEGDERRRTARLALSLRIGR